MPNPSSSISKEFSNYCFSLDYIRKKGSSNQWLQKVRDSKSLDLRLSRRTINTNNISNTSVCVLPYVDKITYRRRKVVTEI